MKPRINKILVISSILTALGSSFCCILPLLGLLLGAVGVVSFSSWVEHFRPYLAVLTSLIIGFAWYRKLRRRKHHCAADKSTSFWQSKTFLGITTVFASATLGLPYYTPLLYAPSSSEEQIIAE